MFANKSQIRKHFSEKHQNYEKYNSNEVLWSFQLDEFIEGAFEVNEDIYYWLINGRVYETEEEV